MPWYIGVQIIIAACILVVNILQYLEAKKKNSHKDL